MDLIIGIHGLIALIGMGCSAFDYLEGKASASEAIIFAGCSLLPGFNLVILFMYIFVFHKRYFKDDCIRTS